MDSEHVNVSENTVQDEVFEPTSASSTGPIMSFQLDELLRQHSESAGNWVEVVDDEIQQSETYRELISDGVTPSQTETSLNDLQYLTTDLPTSPPYIAYVNSIDYRCMEPDIYYLFGGNEKVIDIVLNYQNNRFVGDCLLEFKTQADLAKALALNGTRFFGRRIKVIIPEMPQTSNFNNYSENSYEPNRTKRYESRGSYENTNNYSNRNERYSNERSSSRSSAQGQDNNYYNQNQGQYQQRYQKYSHPKRESNDVRMAHDYNKLQTHIYGTRSRNDSMTSNQSTLERRRIQTPRSTISQAGSELSLAESSATEHTATKKVDLFGGAKPADIKDKFLEYEEKMRREREAHMKMKEEHEKKQRKDSYRERQITPETATAPGQIKILQKDRRTSQGEEVTGTIDSRRESQEPQWDQEKEIAYEFKKEPLTTQTSIASTTSDLPPPPLNRQYSGGKRQDKYTKITATFYNTNRGGHTRGRGAPHKRSTESLGYQRSDKHQRERHYHEKKLSKTSSSDVPVDAKETQEKPEHNSDRRHSVTTSDPASGKPPKAEPPRKDSYQNQGYYGKLQNSKSMENQGYKGGHGGRDGHKSKPHKFYDENYSNRSSSDPTHAKRFPRKTGGKSSRKGSVDDASTPATDVTDISEAPTPRATIVEEEYVAKPNEQEQKKPFKSGSFEEDDRKIGMSKLKENTSVEKDMIHEQTASEPATPVVKYSGGGLGQPSTPENSAKKKENKKKEKMKEKHKMMVQGNKYSALLDAEHD